MTLFFNKRDLVVPGDLLAEGDYELGENVYRIGDKIYATRVGLFELKDSKVSVIALNSFYVPKPGDVVIGDVVDIGVGSWAVDIRAPRLAILRAVDALGKPFRPDKQELSRFLTVGDTIIAKVKAYDRTRSPLLTLSEPGLGKVTSGRIVRITPSKVPRLIGRKGSMISMLKRETGCKIVIGMNGVVLVRCKRPEDEELLVEAIEKIERESHVEGLTDRIAMMIRRRKGLGA
ncbi:MAG TPA: RNA-binding protein [Candidatus Bathyarchaeota archaeon]|nr:RNA-binding protein [Candidatus Bathyarchaeota archaeon]